MGVGCCRCGADDPDDVPVPSGGGCVGCDCCGGGCGEIPDDISGSSELLDDEEEEEEEELRFVVAIGLSSASGSPREIVPGPDGTDCREVEVTGRDHPNDILGSSLGGGTSTCMC